jgi:hypothetical protein
MPRNRFAGSILNTINRYNLRASWTSHPILYTDGVVSRLMKQIDEKQSNASLVTIPLENI